jgi:prefoldin subunit 5
MANEKDDGTDKDPVANETGTEGTDAAGGSTDGPDTPGQDETLSGAGSEPHPDTDRDPFTDSPPDPSTEPGPEPLQTADALSDSDSDQGPTRREDSPPDLETPAEPGHEPLHAADPAPHADTRDEAMDLHEEEAGTSLAARVLTFLVLLLAGAALGIWAAPKIAPNLPSGLAPVAEWLAPASRGDEERIAALETELQGEISALSAQVSGLSDTSALDARIADAVSGVETRTDSAMTDLRDSITALGGDETRQRLARLEARLDGQVAELEALQEQIASGAGASASATSEETAAQIDVYQAQLDGVRAELGTVSDTVAALRNRIDEVAATADRSIDAAQAKVAEIEAETETALSTAAIESDIALIRAAMASGTPFAEPAARLAGDPGVTVPDSLAAAADSGAPTLVTLQERFPDAAHAAIRASIHAQGSNSGVIGRSRAFLEAQIASRSLTPTEGSDPDAVLSRVEGHLRAGDLSAALSEADALPSEAIAAMQGWLDDARLRANAQAGLAELQSSVSTMN